MMERADARCYGFFVASGVSRIVFSEGERWSELTFAATDAWHPA
jgi:hypothetical protein